MTQVQKRQLTYASSILLLLLMIAAVFIFSAQYYDQVSAADEEATVGMQTPEEEITGMQAGGGEFKLDAIQSQPELEDLIHLPLETVPYATISVKYLAEHRAAFNAHPVILQAMVVENYPNRTVCARVDGSCAKSEIIIGESNAPDRDRRYDIPVVLDQSISLNDFSVGSWINLRGIAVGSTSTLYIYYDRSAAPAEPKVASGIKVQTAATFVGS